MTWRKEVPGIDEMEIRLHGTHVAPGEITFAALGEMAEAVQLLATRTGRLLAGQEGPGATPAAVRRASELRLRGLSEGSTRLLVGVGEDDVLTVDGLEQQIVDRVFDVFRGIAENHPPRWATPLIGDAAVGVMRALERTSTSCDVTDPSGRRSAISFVSNEIDRTVWPTSTGSAARGRSMALSGRLEAVDITRARFRLRDRTGAAISLDDVLDAEEAAPLVGTDVTATGTPVVGGDGRILRLTGAAVTAATMPEWSPPSLADAVAQPRHPPEGGIPGLGHDEVVELVELIRE